MASASWTHFGGGIPGAPWDISSKGRLADDVYLVAHSYARGILFFFVVVAYQV